MIVPQKIGVQMSNCKFVDQLLSEFLQEVLRESGLDSSTQDHVTLPSVTRY